jgi:uncharacterized protein (TIGR03435 family)
MLPIARRISSALSLLTLVGSVFLEAAASAQSPGKTATPRFEVASIKPCKDVAPPNGRAGGMSSFSPGRMNVVCQVVKGLIQQAYDQNATGKGRVGRLIPIKGGPAWIDTERYSIEAKAESPESQAMMMGPMLQKLLEDRFKLVIHSETTEGPVYLLTLSKGKPKLQAFKEGACTLRDLSEFPPPPPGPDTCRVYAGRKGPNVSWVAEGLTLDEFCKIALSGMDRPVIDKTELAGRFNFPLEYLPGEAAPSDDPSAGPSIFTALQEQFGLKLEPAKAPGEIHVIDHVERPSEN